MNLEECIQTDYERAKLYYKTCEPRIMGRYAMSQVEAAVLPIDLEAIYETAFEAVAAKPAQAEQYASTFGKISVGVALDGRESSFQFESTDSMRPPDIAEINTLSKNTLAELLTAPEVDASTSYLLVSDDTAVSVEMALIQALHMIDTAIVTGQFDGKLPLIRRITTEEMLRLRNNSPKDILLRIYGNVRGLQSAPMLLGSVVQTTLLEKSGVITKGFKAASDAIVAVRTRDQIMDERLKAAFVGITTAKKPHMGHGFLLVKAIAEANRNGTVLVELNDRGPRVAQALANLAKLKSMTLEEVATGVSDGSICINEIQAAYMSRVQGPVITELSEYSLSDANNYYRKLLSDVMPPQTNTVSIADSELTDLLPELAANPSYAPLFGDSGMALLRDTKSNALVLRQKGALTLAGILGTLSTRFALKLIDSPPPLSATERRIFKESNFAVEQNSGTGLMIDFGIASGTNGAAPLMEELLDIIKSKGADPSLLLPSLRVLLDGAYFLPAEGASLSANFKNRETTLLAFESALDKTMNQDDFNKVLYRPIAFKEIKRDLVRNIISPIYKDCVPSAKPTYRQIARMLGCLPTLKNMISERLQDAVSDKNDIDVSPQKNLLCQKDRDIFSALSSGTPDKVMPMIIGLAPEYSDSLTALLMPSQLPGLMAAMGYPYTDGVEFLGKLQSIRGVYKLS